MSWYISKVSREIFDVHRGIFEVHRGIADVHKGTEEVQKGPFVVEKSLLHSAEGPGKAAQAADDVRFTAQRPRPDRRGIKSRGAGLLKCGR